MSMSEDDKVCSNLALLPNKSRNAFVENDADSQYQ